MRSFKYPMRSPGKLSTALKRLIWLPLECVQQTFQKVHFRFGKPQFLCEKVHLKFASLSFNLKLTKTPMNMMILWMILTEQRTRNTTVCLKLPYDASNMPKSSKHHRCKKSCPIYRFLHGVRGKMPENPAPYTAFSCFDLKHS